MVNSCWQFPVKNIDDCAASDCTDLPTELSSSSSTICVLARNVYWWNRYPSWTIDQFHWRTQYWTCIRTGFAWAWESSRNRTFSTNYVLKRKRGIFHSNCKFCTNFCCLIYGPFTDLPDSQAKPVLGIIISAGKISGEMWWNTPVPEKMRSGTIDLPNQINNIQILWQFTLGNLDRSISHF